jgi:hypothetical protein
VIDAVLAGTGGAALEATFFLAHFVFGSLGFGPVVWNLRYAASSG